MRKRQAILKVGYVQFITDVSTALELDEKLSALTQVTARYIDPDVDDDVVPTGLVWCKDRSTSKVEATLLEKSSSFVDDEDWYDSVQAMREDNDGDS
jgi:hypothetical protein